MAELRVVGPWLEPHDYVNPRPCNAEAHVWVADADGWFYRDQRCKCGQNPLGIKDENGLDDVVAFTLDGCVRSLVDP